MNIDLSKITQAELDQIIKEEAMKIKADMLRESKMTSQQKRLMMEKKILEDQLKRLDESPDIEEGILGKLFGGNKADGAARKQDGAARKQAVLNLLKHPTKKDVLLMYASPEQIAEFKTYVPADKQSWVDWAIKKLGAKKVNDPARAESYIAFHEKGGVNPSWDATRHQYTDAGQISGTAATAFGEGDLPQA